MSIRKVETNSNGTHCIVLLMAIFDLRNQITVMIKMEFKQFHLLFSKLTGLDGVNYDKTMGRAQS